MKKMKLKKVLIAALTMAMVMGSSTMAFAADPTAGGNGEGEGEGNVVAQDDVFTVKVPTDASNYFDYFLDPEGVIEKTNADRYGNKSFETGVTMYFQNTDKEVTSPEVPHHYGNLSNEITAINKSTKEVTIKATATVPSTNTVTMADASATAATVEQIDNDAVLYLALQEVEKQENAPLNRKGSPAVITGTPAKAELDGTIQPNGNAYNTKWVANSNGDGGKYTNQLKPNMKDEDFESYSFSLTGACSKSSAWKTITDSQLPDVTVTWTVTGKGEEVADESESTAPEITNATPVSGKDWDYEATFTKGAELKLSATGLTACTWGDAKDAATSTSALMTISQGTLTIGSGMWKSAVAGAVKYLKLTIGSDTFYVKVTIA